MVQLAWTRAALAPSDPSADPTWSPRRRIEGRAQHFDRLFVGGRLDGRLAALDLRRRIYIVIGNSDLWACLVVSRADFGPIGLNQGRIGTK